MGLIARPFFEIVGAQSLARPRRQQTRRFQARV